MKFSQCGFFAFSILIGLCVSAQRPGSVAHTALSEDRYLSINDARQFISIRSKDAGKNPVLLFLHGGPGASATVLFQKKNRALVNDFTVVCWDQRGAGRSYTRKMDKSKLTVSQLVDDAAVLIDYLCRRFQQQKIFLVGHSWGSRLGMYLVRLYPERIAGYIGAGQEVCAYDGELQSWQYTIGEARRRNNKKALEELEEMGAPQQGDYRQMYRTGFGGLVKQKHWLLKLGGERFERTHYRDWVIAMLAGYRFNMFQLIRWSKASAATSGAFLQDNAYHHFDLRKDIPAVQVPVYFISGRADYNTPWPLVKEYAAQISAPVKRFTLFEKSGHSPLFEEPQRFNAYVRETFLGKESTTMTSGKKPGP